MTRGGGMLLRGMRWRLGASLLTVLTSTIAVGTAVLGPLYLNAASDSVVRKAVDSASIQARGVTLSVFQGQAGSLAQVQRAERVIQDVGGPGRFYGAPLTSVLSGVGLSVQRSPLRSQLFSRTGICGVLHFQRGSCDLRAGDVVVSDRSARELRVGLGAVVAASVAGRRTPLRLRVTGIYSVPNLTLPFWWGQGKGDFPYGQTSGPLHIPQIDPLIASAATAAAVPLQDVPDVEGQVPLESKRVNLADENALRQALARGSGTVSADAVQVSTMLPSLLAGADGQRRVMSTIVAIAAVQLVLLAVWVLGSFLVRSSDARQSEIRVARLRGFPTSSLLWATAAEPAVLCLIGGGLGVALAWVAVLEARSALFKSPAAIAPDQWVFVALALTVVAIAGAVGIGTVRLLRAAGRSESRSTRATGAARPAGLIADVVLVALSVVALVALSTTGGLGGHGDPIASAAPGLIALGTAVLAVQLVLFACRLGISATAASGWVATFLALRQTGRRPGVVRQARVLVIAVCLACFATSAWSVARANRVTQADFTVGTASVATVTPGSGGLQQAVDRVDPRSRFAMAAVSATSPSSAVLAVEAPRLPVAASWPRGVSARSIEAISRALTPRSAPEVTLEPRPVTLVATTTTTTTTTTTATATAATGLGRVELGLWVFNPQLGTTLVSLGALHAGAWTYGADLTSVCPGGCRLAGLGVVPVPGRPPLAEGTVRVHVSAVFAGAPSARTPVSADLSAGGWRSAVSGVSILAATGRGLTIAIPADVIAGYVSANGSVSIPMAAPADHPATLPAVVTSEVQSLNGAVVSGSVPAQGLDGSTLNVAPVASVPALPRIGDNAVMVDLDLLARAQVGPTTPDVIDEVWLGPSAPPDVLARLRAAGLTVDTVQRATTVFSQLQRTGPALADDFLLVATIAALLTATASTLGALGATTRERATELASLEVAGVRRPVLVRSLAVESGVLVLTAACGVVAGVVAAVIAIPSLPELAAAPVIPLQYRLPAGLIAAVSAAVLALVLAATAAIAVILVRRMSPGLLRTAPNDASG